jgi:hypothetical protein
VGASIGGLSFFTAWMDRYRLYFVVAGILAMLSWLVRLGGANTSRDAPGGRPGGSCYGMPQRWASSSA